MERFKVIPKEGLLIRDPIDMLQIPKEGKLVYKTPYWNRLIKDGDVTTEEKIVVKPKKKKSISSEMKEVNNLENSTLEKDD